MDSFNGNGRDRGPRRRREAGNKSRRRRPDLESLEPRQLLSTGNVQPTYRSTSTNLLDVHNGPMADAGANLIKIYGEYQTYLQNGGHGAFQSSLSKLVEIRGTTVGVDISVYGDLNAFQTAVKSLGMQVTAVDTTRKIVEGFLPIAQLPTVTQMVGTVGLNAIYTPNLNQQGIAANQGDQALKADVARTQFNVNGAGVTVGVLSDSASQFAGGLADSVRTGDLPSNVNILLDGPAGSTDEGRAMIEQIYRHRARRQPGLQHGLQRRSRLRQRHPRPGQHGRRQGDRR